MSHIVINPTLPKPFTRLTFLRKEPVSEDTPNDWGIGSRKYYQRYSYRKAYSVEKRVAIFQKCVTHFITSYGRSLFTWKHWRQLKKVCLGSSVKQAKILDPWIKIETLASSSTEIPGIPMERLINFGSQLQLRGIDLDCINPAPLTAKNQKRPEVIKAFFAQAQQQEWWKPNTAEWISLMRKLFNAVDVITFEELQLGLFNCCQKLQSLLGDKEYAIGFAKRKSTQWIAELALGHLLRAPIASFSHASDNMNVDRSFQSRLDPRIQNYVIFDDAAYSGQQLREIIGILRRVISGLPGHNQYSLYVVMPFMSCHAIKTLNMYAESDVALPGKVNVKIITTQRRVKAMTDVLSKEEFDRLFAIEGSRALSSYCNGRTRNKCLTFMEWKVPDHASMPKDFTTWEEVNPERTGLVDKDRFITDYPPPYKTERPRR